MTRYEIKGLLGVFYDNEEAEALKMVKNLEKLGIKVGLSIYED